MNEGLPGNILVTGGAGYIGSHVVRDLLDRGYSVLVLDDLSTGHIKAVDKRANFFWGNIGDSAILDQIFQHYPVAAVMHFAANALVGESKVQPLKYYRNNVANTLVLLEKMLQYNIKKFIFSSTCATYGIYDDEIHERLASNPINPYGNSKLMVETILKDLAEGYEFEYVVLRYFNVAGAHHLGELGEEHTPETHLIPNILRNLQGKNGTLEIYGDDYDTPDGTCIRDFIHVSDLSEGHILALQYLLRNPSIKINETFNLGTGKGNSVLEIIQLAEQITGLKANFTIKPRRDGDPPKLVASAQKVKDILGWEPKYDIYAILETAWKWHQKRPNGY